MLKHRILLLLLMIAPPRVWAAEELASSVSLGPVVVGENRLPISAENFALIVQVPGVKAQAHLLPQSLEWVRVNQILLTPRALAHIEIEGAPERMHLRYLGKSYILQAKEGRSYTELHVSLFSPSEIEIFRDGKKIGFIELQAKPATQKEKHLIDYSCAPYELKFEGLEDQYVSVGCQLIMGDPDRNQSPILEVVWATTNYRLLDKSPPPYVSKMIDSEPVSANLTNNQGEQKKIRILAKVPPHTYRLKLAFGFGPYFFSSQEGTSSMPYRISPSVMLYGNYLITRAASVRFFNAVVYNRSIFNNFGAYYAYTAAQAFDDRLHVIPLLGFQVVTFKHHSGNKTLNRMLLPQGFETIYMHAFGMKNYHLIFGMFFSTSTIVDYNNLWLRFGKRVFWEINYIGWGFENKMAKTWGLSVGLPLAQLF